MTKPIYYKAKRFFPTSEYEINSKIFGRNEIVTFDILCKNIEENYINYTEYLCDWNYGVSDWKLLISTPLQPNEQVIACFKNPTESYEFHKLDDWFEFCGYDLSDSRVFISAITNCNGEFEKAIAYGELNKFGLISEYNKAFQTRELLEEFYPEEEHANCDIYEIWRRV